MPKLHVYLQIRQSYMVNRNIGGICLYIISGLEFAIMYGFRVLWSSLVLKSLCTLKVLPRISQVEGKRLVTSIVCRLSDSFPQEWSYHLGKKNSSFISHVRLDFLMMTSGGNHQEAEGKMVKAQIYKVNDVGAARS